MRKSLLTILISCCMFIGATTVYAENPDFDDLIEENSLTSLFTHHDSIRMDRTYYYEESPVFSDTVYFEPDVLSLDNSLNNEEYVDRNNYFLTVDADRDGVAEEVVDILLEDELAYETLLQEMQKEILIPDSSEKIVDRSAEDGKIIIKTELKDGLFVRGFKDMLEEYLSYGAAYGSYTYEDGMSLKYEYTFREDNHDLMEFYTMLCEKDGTEHLHHRTVLVYDEPYDMCPLVTAQKESEDKREITVVFKEGSLKTYSCPKGAYLDVMVNGAYPEKLYLEADGSAAYTWQDDDLESNLTLYIG